MSEKTEVDQDYDEDEEGSDSPSVRPEHQYSKDELLTLRESPASRRRPKCLERAFDAEDGKWDPDRWYKAKFGLSREASPLTLGESKERRRLPEIERDLKRRPSLNDPVERLKEERDGIVLSPQRRSFGTGCHVQTQLAYTRQTSMPERDRDDSRGERDRDRDAVRDRERDSRDRPVRKIGSGRIPIDRENSRDFSGLRDRYEDRDIRDRDRDRERDRDFTWNRDRDIRDREWDRDRERDLRDPGDWDRDRDRDRRFERSDRFRRVGDSRDFPERDRRDRDFRDRGFERNSRRRNNYREEEKEPEWFTGGPTSQTDTIELRGFEREPDNDSEDAGSRKSEPKQNGNRRRATPREDKSSKESSEEASEPDVKVSQRSSPEEDQQSAQRSEAMDKDQEVHGQQAATPQPNSRSSPSGPKSFDFEEILNASLPLDEENVRQSSRFSRFFSGLGGNGVGADSSIVENMLVPHDLLDDSRTSPGVPSPTSMLGPKGAGYLADPGLTQHGMHHYAEQHGGLTKDHFFSLAHNMMSVPNSAGDNNAAAGKSALPPAVTALFNSAAMGGSNASISSNNSFSTQDAEAQLKAMLFGGHKESASSSGTASPASLPPNVQRKVKTVAELEADMHQNSPQKTGSPVAGVSSGTNPTSSGDMTAFNKLLIMINAASEASQNTTQTEPTSTRPGYGMVPSHSEFNHAVLRNKEEQMQLLQQSLQNAQRQPQPGMLSQLPPHSMHHHHQMPPPSMPSQQQQQPPPPPMLSQQQVQAQAAALQHLQKQQQLQQQQAASMNHPKPNPGLVSTKPPSTPGLPQAMSTPHQLSMKPRSQSGGPTTSTDPIFNLIQQNPTIVMNPASPAPPLAAMLVSQSSAVPNTARVPSPLMFSQQPPLHLSAPSPIHPGQLSPRSLTVGANLAGSTMSSPSGMRSPVRGRVLSPQELSAHAQAVMQSALIKKQLQDQNERYIRKQQERAKSPSQLPVNIVKSHPAAQPVLPPNPQPKGASVNTFTPTSVLRKMHSDKALEKEKQAQEHRGDEETEYMPSMRELSSQGDNGDSHSLEGGLSRKSDPKLMGDLSDISFLDPVNPNLVAMSNQLENQLCIGQTNILPGTLSQPMSVEEKLKLSALAEKPGYLSQMLDKSAKVAAAAEAARTGHGRPIVKAPEPIQEDRNLQQHQHFMQQQHMQQPPPPLNQGGRPVTGSGTKMAPPSFAAAAATPTNMAPPTSIQQNNAAGKQAGGRAIVGGNSIQQQSSMPVVVSSAANMDMMRLLEQQHLQQQQHMQRLQQVSHAQGMVVPPPPMGTPIACLGPPPVGVPVTARFPVVATNAALMQQHYARANAQAQRNHYMAMQQAQAAQQRGMAPLSPLHTGVPGVTGPLSPRAQASGPLTTAALSATIQRVASPHGAMKMNGPLTQTSSVNGGGVSKVDVGSGIQRWFSPDILKTQLPSMPPLPTQGSHVMTVDELERN